MTSNRRWKRNAMPAAVGIVLLSISACGSSGTRTSTPATAVSTADGPKVEPAFKARATAVCKEAGNKLRAEGSFPFPSFDAEHPDAPKLPAIANFEAKTVAVERSWQAQLIALGHPASGSITWDIFLNRVDRAVKETAAQQVAAQRGDGAAFTKTFHELSSSGLANSQVAAALGLALCDPGALGTTSPEPVPVRRPGA
jgi:hypothetical protein